MPATPPRMLPKVKVLRVNGKPFVCGLFWQPLTRPRAYMKEAREIGKRESMEIVAIRRSTIIQAGFVAKHQGALKGMVSMAAALAGLLGPSWLGVFVLDDGHYVLAAVNDRAIVPGCDLTGDHAAVRAKEWGVGIAVAALLAAIVSVYFIRAVQHRKARERAEHLRRQQLAQLNAQNQQKQMAPLEHPWARQPSVENFLTGCLNAVYTLPLVIRGWTFETARCTAPRIEAVYARSGRATVHDFMDGACAHFESEPVIHGGGERASCVYPLTPIPSGDDALEPIAAAAARLSSYFQSLGIPLRLAEKADPTQASQALPGQLPSPSSSAPDWKTWAFQFTMAQAPQTLLSGLSGAGIRLTELSVKSSAAKLTWNVTGELYAR